MAREYTDEEIIGKVRKGDPQAFSLLVRKYQQKIIKTLRYYVHDGDEIHDLSQEVFLKAFLALDNFRGDSRFYTWLYRIAVNTAKNYLYTKSHHTPYLDVDITQDFAEPANYTLLNKTSPEESLIQHEEQLSILKSIHALPKNLRKALVLREIGGYTYKEIADTIGCPVGTVRSRIYRARETIDRRIRKTH